MIGVACWRRRHWPKAVKVPLGALGDQTKLSSTTTTILFTVPTLTLTIFSVKPHITSTIQCSEWRNLVLRVGGSVTMKRGVRVDRCRESVFNEYCCQKSSVVVDVDPPTNLIIWLCVYVSGSSNKVLVSHQDLGPKTPNWNSTRLWE